MNNLNHLDNFCNNNKNPINPPTQLSKQEAENLNLNKIMILENKKSLGQKIFDNVIKDQMFTILQIVPAKDAIPNQDGILAFIKIRGGSFPDQDSASKTAIKIVQEQDQLSTNFVVPIGCPLPIKKELTHLEKKDTIFVDLKNSNVNQEWRWLLKKEKEEDQKIQTEVENKLNSFQEKINEEESLLEKYSKDVVIFVDLIKNFQKKFDEINQSLDKLIFLNQSLEKQNQEYPTLKNEFITFIEDFDKKSGYIRGKSLKMDNILNERKEQLLNSKQLYRELFENGKCICHKLPKFV